MLTLHRGERFQGRRAEDSQRRTPASRAPVFGFTDELDHAARVTEKAEMDIPSPPFSSCREEIL